jgi:hypothetical protein
MSVALTQGQTASEKPWGNQVRHPPELPLPRVEGSVFCRRVLSIEKGCEAGMVLHTEAPRACAPQARRETTWYHPQRRVDGFPNRERTDYEIPAQWLLKE